MEWLERILGQTNRQRPVSIHIHIRNDGFDLVAQTSVPYVIKIDWEDIRRIEANVSEDDEQKSASLTFFRYWDRHTITVERGDVGFDQLPIALANAFPDIPIDWMAEIEAPFGFAPHRVLYDADNL